MDKELEDRRFLRSLDEERERIWNALLRYDDLHREHIDLFLRPGVKSARIENWPGMRQSLQQYCEQESKYRLGPLASFMEQYQIEIQAGNPNTAVEIELISELYQLCRAFLIASSDTYDSIVESPTLSVNDKRWRLTNLRWNLGYCKETLDWIVRTYARETREQKERADLSALALGGIQQP